MKGEVNRRSPFENEVTRKGDCRMAFVFIGGGAFSSLIGAHVHGLHKRACPWLLMAVHGEHYYHNILPLFSFFQLLSSN